MALVDEQGAAVVVGETLGRWLEAGDFFFGGEDHEEDEILELGPHTFPRDWPDVYEESAALRGLLGRRGICAAKRVSVVPKPQPLDGLEVRYLQSYANACNAAIARGLEVVEGWAIYDLLDDVTGAAFLAERYWWNAGPDGTWYDYSPFPENMEFMLLAEAFCPTGPREPEALTQQQQALAELLLRRRFPKARRAKLGLVTLKAPPLPEPKAAPELPEAEPAEDAPAPIPEPEAACASGEVAPEQPLTGQQPQSEQREQPEPEQAEPAEQPEQQEEREATPEPAPPEPVEEPLTAEAARQLARRCKEEHGPGAVAEALRRLNCAESCDRLITAGLSGALVPQLGRRDGVQLLRALCEKSLKPGPGCPAHKRVAEALMSADGMKSLVAQLAVKELGPWAAFALGHLCIRNPLAQVRAGRCQAIRCTVRLLSRAKDFQQLDALEAGTYALWNLLVGQRDHALVAFREGAAAVLLPLLSPRTGGEVLQNALGATSSLLMAGQAAQDALGANGAVAALCGLLDSPAAEQAAAALGNLLSGHAENGRRAEASRALPRLLQLLRLAATEQRSKLAENCCAALANLVAGTHTAQAAVEAGILDLVSEVMPFVVRPAQVFGLLANICHQLPERLPEILRLTPVQRLVDVLKPKEEAPKASLAAVALSANLASLASAKTQLLRAGLLPPLAKAIESSTDQQLRLQAAICLANLLEDSGASVAKAFLELPDLPRRLSFLLSNQKAPLPAATRRHVARALALLSSREASRVAVKESGAPEALNQLLAEAEPLAKEAAFGFLNLALVSKDRDKILKKNLAERLVNLLPSPEAGPYAAGALANLTAGSACAARAALRAGAVRGLRQQLLRSCQEHEVTGQGFSLEGSVEKSAAVWVLGALGHILDLSQDPAAVREAAAAVQPACEVLRSGEGAVRDIAVFCLAALDAGSPNAPLPALPNLEEALAKVEGPMREKALQLRRRMPR